MLAAILFTFSQHQSQTAKQWKLWLSLAELWEKGKRDGRSGQWRQEDQAAKRLWKPQLSRSRRTGEAAVDGQFPGDPARVKKGGSKSRGQAENSSQPVVFTAVLPSAKPWWRAKSNTGRQYRRACTGECWGKAWTPLLPASLSLQ